MMHEASMLATRQGSSPDCAQHGRHPHRRCQVTLTASVHQMHTCFAGKRPCLSSPKLANLPAPFPAFGRTSFRTPGTTCASLRLRTAQWAWVSPGRHTLLIQALSTSNTSRSFPPATRPSLSRYIHHFRCAYFIRSTCWHFAPRSPAFAFPTPPLAYRSDCVLLRL